MSDQLPNTAESQSSTAASDPDKIYKKHREHLREANARTQHLYQDFTSHSKWAIGATLAAYLIALLASIGIVVASFLLLFLGPKSTFSYIFIAMAFVIGASMVVGLILVNPARFTRQWSIESLKISMVYFGYMRQIQQIDSAFKLLLLKNDAKPEDFEKLSVQVHQAVEQAMEMFMVSSFDTPV